MSAQVVPHERAVMDSVIGIWQTQPETERIAVKKLLAIVKERNSDWALSEKRLKTILTTFNLLPISEADTSTYAKDIISSETPNLNLPKKVHLVMTSKRGKGLFAKYDIEKGELLWEEAPLFLVPPLAYTELIIKGSACTLCGRLIRRSRDGTSMLIGEECKWCPEAWCSKVCKKRGQKVHGALKHEQEYGSSKRFNVSAFSRLVTFCVKEQWNALLALTYITAEVELDASRMKDKQFKALARVSQRLRTKAINGTNNSGVSQSAFVEEQHEKLWEEGYANFMEVFPSLGSEISYENFLVMLGAYNINNLDSSIFLVQSHLNHNCEPNTKVESGDSRAEPIRVFSSRAIRAGEEITTSYVNPSYSCSHRQEELRVNWGFVCKCKRCKRELSAGAPGHSYMSDTLQKSDTKSVRFENDVPEE